jgi:hypothetical protein
MSRTNLITNPSFKTNTTGWSISGGSTITRVTYDYYYGASSLEVAKAASPNSGVALTDRIAVAQAITYAVSAYVKIPAASNDGEIQIVVDWYTALTGGSFISSSTSSLVAVSAGASWTRLAKVVTAPTAALGAVVKIIQPTAGLANDKFLVDAVLFERSSAINLYVEDPTQGQETAAVNKALSALPPPVFSGLKLSADVQLNNLILSSIDENSVVWVLTDIKGWWEHPDPEVPDIDRGWGDGSYDVRGRWRARQIEIEGVFLPQDPALVAISRDKLIRATDLVYSNAWLFVNENPTKASRVRLSGKPNIETVNTRGRTEFSIGLRAADPIKYEWNWEQVDGYSTVTIPGQNAATTETGTRTITNNGNTNVSVIFEITGPLTGPASIYNFATDQLLTIVQPLRAATSRDVTNKELEDDVATLTTDVAHGFISGDRVTVSISDAVFDGTHTILDTPTAVTFTYARTGTNVAPTSATGTASIPVDVLEIDTYNKEVALNGSIEGTRSMVDTLVDWTLLSPGANELNFVDDGEANSTASVVVYYRSGWIG